MKLARAAGLGAPLAALALVGMAPGPARSPDGLELIAQIHEGHPGWAWAPPLWTWSAGALALPFGDAAGAWALNVAAAALCCFPLARLGRALAGPAGELAAPALWAALPAVRAHAAVTDARPLSWLAAAWALCLGVEAARGGRGWGLAFAAAGVAALTRPEGLALLPAIAAGAAVSGAPWRSWGGPLGLALAAWLGWTAAAPGRGAWEGLWAGWSSVWTTADFIAWMGSASAGSPARAEVEALLAAGPPPPRGPSVDGVGERLQALWIGLRAATGLSLAAAGLGGLARLGRRDRGAAALLGLGVAPVAGLALLPMAWGQSTAAAQVLWVGPALVALAVAAAAPVGRRRGPRVTRAVGAAGPLGGLSVALLIELYLISPAEGPPAFVGDAPAARAASAWMGQVPPRGSVWCSFSSRVPVRAGGGRPAHLPPLWSAFTPGPDDRVWLSFADLQGEDGGRGLALLRSGAWVVEAAFEDPVDPADPLRPRGWVAILRPRGAGPG